MRKEKYVENITYGKLPPQLQDVERAVLAALIFDTETLYSVVDLIKDDYFYNDQNRIIWVAIKSMYNRNIPIDMLSVCDELTKSGDLENVGGYYYITKLNDGVTSSINTKNHIKMLAEKAVYRRLITSGTEVVQLAYDQEEDCFILAEKLERSAQLAAAENGMEEIASSEDLMKECLEEVEAAIKSPDGATGVHSGFENLDRVTGGWQKSDLIILAARPSMGKSALALNFARNAAVQFYKKAAVFSLEMSRKQLGKRLISSESEIPLSNILYGRLTPDEFMRTVKSSGVIADAGIFIDDTSYNMQQIKTKSRRYVHEFGVELIIIDYIQLISSASENKNKTRENEVSEISRELKMMAKELDVPVIALSQLSRAVESRGGSKRPMLSDLRESGAIEQDADIVAFLYRPEYYGIEVDENGNSTRGIAEIIIAKNRSGALDNIKTAFIGNLTKFTNLTSQPLPNMKPLKEVVNYYETKETESEEPPF